MLTTVALTALIGGGLYVCGLYNGLKQGFKDGTGHGLNSMLDFMVESELITDEQFVELFESGRGEEILKSHSQK